MYLGIEIGGTKLQLGVGRGESAELIELTRHEVDRAAGAEGILRRIEEAARPLIARHSARRIGIGFGGPIDTARGRALKSHQVEGWDDFALVAWCHEKFSLPATLANDADLAALAEARFGAGRGRSPVLYVTVGTGIGGGLVIDGELYRGNGAGAMEIGHLLPTAGAYRAERVVERFASGPGISREARAPLADARDVFEAAASGDAAAEALVSRALMTLGWAIAQAITLLSPAVVVVGGGVSLAGEARFFEPLRREVASRVFPAFRETYEILHAALGEEMVVHGALLLAARDAAAKGN